MNENINGNHDLQDNNKKLIFDSNLDPDINLRYIQDWNNAFASNPNFDDEKQIYTKPMARIIFVDLKKMSQKISDGDYKESKNNYGIISEDFMSSLMYEWFYFTDCENILWEILNASEGFTDTKEKNTIEVHYEQLNKTQNSRIKKLMNTNFGDRLIKDNNYDASDVEDCYFEYANSKYADRYFFYFNKLENLSGYAFKDTNEEYEKYNVENIKKV